MWKCLYKGVPTKGWSKSSLICHCCGVTDRPAIPCLIMCISSYEGNPSEEPVSTSGMTILSSVFIVVFLVSDNVLDFFAVHAYDGARLQCCPKAVSSKCFRICLSVSMVYYGVIVNFNRKQLPCQASLLSYNPCENSKELLELKDILSNVLQF